MVNTVFILDEGYNTARILSANRNSQKAFWDDLYTQEFDTGAESFEFSCYASEEVKEGNYVIFLYNNQYKMFTIMDIEQEHKQGKLVTHCYCEISALSLLGNYVRKFNGDMNCIQFFQHILQDTGWEIGKHSTSLEDKVETINVSSTKTVWSLIEDYKDIFECEINVRVTYENGHLTGRYIDIYSEGGLGTPTLKRFEHGRNVTGIVKQKDLYDWCTAIIVDCNCDVTDTIIEASDGYGFTKGAGDIILDENHNRMYNSGKNYVVGVYSGEETEPVEACINAWKELLKRSVPKFDYNVTTALTEEEYEEIHLGDTVHVIDYSYTPPLFLEARVGKLELSFTDRTQNKCNLTNYKEVKSKLLDADYIKLTGTIKDVVDSFFPITSEGIADGAIVDGKIETTYFEQITADIISAGIGVFEDLYAKNMTVINADIENLKATNAEIENLKASFAEIDNLKASVAEIDTLINGHLTSDNIQSIIITGDKFTVADAFIKDAMIDTVSARKISTGVLNTNNVQIQSEDGSMLLQGSLQQFKDSSGKVRIQIGKDAQGNFTFALFSQDGVGVLIDESGVKEGAIGDGIIVDAMVSEDANIKGDKLDINSVISSINDGTTTIKGSRIYLDDEGQSLKVAFNQLKTKVETIEDVTVDGDLSSIIEQVTSNTTNINIMQGEISSLISNTTITKQNGQVVQLKDEYNSIKNTVDSHATKIGALETTVDSVSSKQASMELNLDGFKTSVSSTYATKSQLNTTNSNVSTAQSTANTANSTANSALNKANTNASNITTISNKYSSLEQDVDSFKTTVSNTYATKEDLEEVGGVDTSNFVTKSEYQQTANKMSWMVKSGTSQSNMVLTDKMYSLISDNITLSADRIDLNGYINANGSFQVYEDGSVLLGYPIDSAIFLDAEDGAILCYDEIIERSRIQNGKFYFQNDSGAKVGYVGANYWASATSKWLTAVNAEYGNTVGLGARYTSDGLYTCPIIVSSIDQYLGDIHVYQGANISNGHITNGLNLHAIRTASETNCAFIEASQNSGYGLRVYGNNYGLCLGLRNNANLKVGMQFILDSAQSNGVYANAYTPINMNNYKIYNSSISSTSDRTLKENIKYLDYNNINPKARTVENDDITLDDMYNFINNDYMLANYNYIGEEEKTISAVAQDLLVNIDGTDNKVGQLVTHRCKKMGSTSEETIIDIDTENGKTIEQAEVAEGETIAINQTELLNITIGALQKACEKIESLEKQIQQLQEYINIGEE